MNATKPTILHAYGVWTQKTQQIPKTETMQRLRGILRPNELRASAVLHDISSHSYPGVDGYEIRRVRHNGTPRTTLLRFFFLCLAIETLKTKEMP